MFVTFWSALQRAISARVNYWNTVRELNLLSDRDLGDLGIRRCDIEFIAKKTSGVVR